MRRKEENFVEREDRKEDTEVYFRYNDNTLIHKEMMSREGNGNESRGSKWMH